MLPLRDAVAASDAFGEARQQLHNTELWYVFVWCKITIEHVINIWHTFIMPISSKIRLPFVIGFKISVTQL